MRVTTGLARGRNLEAPQGLDTRPSSDMTKQAVFNIIQNYVEGCVFLDLFAGSGQMGIEALSRGAKQAVFIDSSSKAVEVVKTNLKHCGLMEQARVAQMEAKSFLQNGSQKFDVIFLDPPYQQQMIDAVLPLAVERLEENGIIVCETERNETLPEQAGEYVETKTYLYGKAKVTVYRKREPEGEE